MKLKNEFYLNSDVWAFTKKVLGKKLVTRDGRGRITSGIIVEAEAYHGTTDRASHAYGGRRSRRNEPMYKSGGRAYVYLIYGRYAMFNIVSGKEGQPDAVLIRSVEPLEGIKWMLARRHQKKAGPLLTNGPGRLCEALGIEVADSDTDLCGERIWLEYFPDVPPEKIVCGPRIGVAYAGDDAARPWRFALKTTPYISKPF